MIALRLRHPALRRRRFLDDAAAGWHGVEPFKPDFSDVSRSLALTLDGRRTGREPDQDFYIAFNAWHEALAFGIPPAPQGKPWRRVVDTALAPPLEIVDQKEGPVVEAGAPYRVSPFSLLVLIGEA
jgi:glycogen operon protein